MEKRTRTHGFADLKAASADAAKLQRTKTSARDAAALGMDSEAVVRVIQALRYPGDFDKCATAHHDPTRWRESDQSMVDVRRLYLKVTTDETGTFLLASFKAT